ncbi:MAG: FixH family protein [Candidatus Binatia bacterium]
MNSSSTGVVAPPLARALKRTDSKPWFRQFWPWFLIALPATSVVFSFATLYIAVREADEVLPHQGDSTSYSAPKGPAAGAGIAPAAEADIARTEADIARAEPGIAATAEADIAVGAEAGIAARAAVERDPPVVPVHAAVERDVP